MSNKSGYVRDRNMFINFRMSPMEKELLEKRIAMCGAKDRQEYLIESALYNKIEACANPLMLLSLRIELRHIEDELKRIDSGTEIEYEMLYMVQTMYQILQAYADRDGIGKEMIKCKETK